MRADEFHSNTAELPVGQHAMSGAGAIPYFGDAYMADTRHLTLEEHGAYHLLLLIAWRSPHCALPDNDRRLCQMLGTTAKKWARLKPAVMAFWTITENGWEQKRLTKERRWVEKKSEQNRNSASTRWGAKSLETKKPNHANAHANAYANGYAPPPPPTKEVSSKEEDKSAEPTDKPLTISEIAEAWNLRMVPQGFAEVKRITEERKRKAKARIRENTIEEWEQAMAAIERSAFLRGENDRGWKADFDFLLQPKSFTKLLEGAYDH